MHADRQGQAITEIASPREITAAPRREALDSGERVYQSESKCLIETATIDRPALIFCSVSLARCVLRRPGVRDQPSSGASSMFIHREVANLTRLLIAAIALPAVLAACGGSSITPGPGGAGSGGGTSSVATSSSTTGSGGSGGATGHVHVSNYDDLPEGFRGTSFSYEGVTYRDLNGVGGVFPDGSPVGPDDSANEFAIENAKLLYDDFPDWGSPNNALTFGPAYIDGDNLSLGAFASAWMDLDRPADSIRFDMVFYENGPWGGIVYHLDAYRDGEVVGTDSFTIQNPDDHSGKDNIAFSSLSVSGVRFDSCHIYATFGSDYSLPRLMIDNLTINSLE